MAPLAVRLAEAGYRAVAFDVAGHGESAETEARWEWFIRDIGDVSTSLSTPLAGFIGHSAGALAMMAARRIRSVPAAGFVCICAPHHPYPPITAIRQRLNPGDPVIRMYRNYLGTQFSSDWESLETGFAWKDAGHDLLLCYDKTDRYIDKGDGELINAACPGSALVTYNQYGHTRILEAEPLAPVVTDFLRSKQVRGEAWECRSSGVPSPTIALES
jgi:pimeloyl-ACP methyl ester carboxylesterase